MISGNNRHRAGHHRPYRTRREIAPRVPALVCLLILLAQLAFAVAHTWEVSGEAATASAALTVQRSPTGTEDTPVLFKAVAAPRRGAHDPLLCTICQLFSQAKHAIALHSTGIFLLETSFAFLLGSSFHGSDLELAASAPRAPPSLA